MAEAVSPHLSLKRTAGWNACVLIGLGFASFIASGFELESARKLDPDTPAAIDDLAQILQPLGPQLDIVFTQSRDWPTGTRVAAALARCAEQYAPFSAVNFGPRGEGPSLLDAPPCLVAKLENDPEARQRALAGARMQLAKLPVRFKPGQQQAYDRSLYDFVTAGLVLASLTPIRGGRPMPSDAELLLGLLNDEQKPIIPRLELAYALLAAQWLDPARAATQPFDQQVRSAWVRLALAEFGTLGAQWLPAHKREDPVFIRHLATYPDVIEALRSAGALAARKEGVSADVGSRVVQPLTLEALGPLQVEYMHGYYETKGDELQSRDAGKHVLQYVADDYRAELVRTVHSRYLYDEAVWELTWRRGSMPATLRALIEVGYVPWKVDLSRAQPRLLFDPPPAPLPGAHVPRAPRPLRYMTFVQFREVMPETAARIIAATSNPECSSSVKSIYVENDLSRGIAFELCPPRYATTQLVGLRFDPTQVVRVSGIEYDARRGGSRPAVLAVYDADRDGLYEVLLDEEEDIAAKSRYRTPWLLEEYQGVFRYFHADPPRL
jgi:hypothetical protein